MPAYYPNLNSVKNFAENMQKQPDEAKRYKGIVPANESELPEAREQLGAYMREIWGDEVAALEIELAVNKENYREKFHKHLNGRFSIQQH